MEYSGGPEDREKKHLGKHNRKPTVCNDMRRQYDHCGICGSGNVVDQGVGYCKICGAETEYLTEHRSWYYSNMGEAVVPCDCMEERSCRIKGRTKRNYYRPIRNLFVNKCLDCGAVRSRYCPNQAHHECWGHWDGRLFCTCGFRRGPIFTP